MWGSTGRSGIGEQSLPGTYDDWNGLSPNGRQVKNELTGLTRQLAGADYWHTRKSIKPEQITPEVWVNGKANVSAFADKPTPKTTKKTISIRDRICPQQKTYERLEQMQKDLEQEFTEGKLTDEEYLSLSAVLDKKLQRSWVLLAKAMNWKDEEETELYCDDFYLVENNQQDKAVNIKRNRELVGVLSSLNDDNVFRVCWCHWLDVKHFCSVFHKELHKEVKLFTEKTKKFIDYVKAGF